MYYLQFILFKIKCFSTNIIVQFLIFLNGIKASHGVKYNGFPILKRKPNSYIQIGENAIFNSTQKSNLIGVNRKCVIATHKKGAQLIIGKSCGFSGTVMGAFEKIEFGDNVICGGNTLITDSDWHGTAPDKRDPKSAKSSPIYISNNVWLGVNVVVLKGVTIGENSIIAPNSVVVKDIPANVLAGGNPCVVIKSL